MLGPAVDKETEFEKLINQLLNISLCVHNDEKFFHFPERFMRWLTFEVGKAFAGRKIGRKRKPAITGLNFSPFPFIHSARKFNSSNCFLLIFSLPRFPPTRKNLWKRDIRGWRAGRGWRNLPNKRKGTKQEEKDFRNSSNSASLKATENLLISNDLTADEPQSLRNNPRWRQRCW